MLAEAKIPPVITMDSNKVVTAYFLQYDYTGSDLRINTDALPAWVEGNYGAFTLDATGGTGTKILEGHTAVAVGVKPVGNDFRYRAYVGQYLHVDISAVYL